MNSSCRGELEPLVWTYVSAGTVGLAGMGIIQLMIYGLFYAVEALVDGYPDTSKNWIFNIITSLITTGLLEGVAKVLPVLYARRRGSAESRKPRNRAYVDYVLAGVLGLDLAQNLQWLPRFCIQEHETLPRTVHMLFTRFMMGTLVSLVLGTSTALRAIRKDHLDQKLNWWSVIAPSVISYGLFNFAILSCGTLAGQTGWQFPSDTKMQAGLIGTLVGVIGVTIWQVMQDWRLVNEHEVEKA